MTKTLEQITAAILDQAEEKWERANSPNFHSLVLTNEGNLYWHEAFDIHSVPMLVWENQATRLCVFQGVPSEDSAHESESGKLIPFIDRFPDWSYEDYMASEIKNAEEFYADYIAAELAMS